MSTGNRDAPKPAKITAIENFVWNLKSDAGKELVLTQETNQIIGPAARSWLPTQNEKCLIDFSRELKLLSLSPGRSGAIRHGRSRSMPLGLHQQIGNPVLSASVRIS